MFRFWDRDTWGYDKNVGPIMVPPVLDARTLKEVSAPMSAYPSVQPPKKRPLELDASDESNKQEEATKRVKANHAPSQNAQATCDSGSSMLSAAQVDTARETIRHEFGLEILIKHNELRLIDQEIAKCQIALEQLRRCHLVPYPVNCPTPEQMLNISAGQGFAIATQPGEAVPEWAPPFGVVDGPYARHYARWLIPDPCFDGIEPGSHHAQNAHSRTTATEGRATRNSIADSAGSRSRTGRGSNSRQLQALSTGPVQARERPPYCTVRRSDGVTVKLVCVDCDRFNFSSTQGFINHCRIAHKRDYKSHEEAAVHCGQPIDVPAPTVDERYASVSSSIGTGAGTGIGTGSVSGLGPSPVSGSSELVHPFNQPNVTGQDIYVSLLARIRDSTTMMEQGKLPGFTSVPTGSAMPTEKASHHSQTGSAVNFHGSSATPYLSKLLAKRNFSGNLSDIVTDARTPVSLEDMSAEEESEDLDTMLQPADGTGDGAPSRSPVMMRMPARSAAGTSPAPQGPAAHTVGSKGRAPHLSFVPPPNSAKGMMSKVGRGGSITSDEEAELEDANLSPHTLVSNNAPSLVSDDGEYDSDEGCSVSGASDGLESDAVPDMAEFALDDEHDARPLRRGSSGVSGAVALRKVDPKDPKHVPFIGPVKGSPKERRSRNA
jgi:ADA HAT complex component 1